MKKKGFLLFGALAALGIASLGGAAAAIDVADAAPAEALTIEDRETTDDETVRFTISIPDSYRSWFLDNVSVYAWTGSTTNASFPGESFEIQGEAGNYYAEIELDNVGYEKIIVSNRGDGYTGQSGDWDLPTLVTVPSPNIYYTLTFDGWNSPSWSYTTTSLQGTDTFRVWLQRKTDYESGYTHTFHYWYGDDIDEEIAPTDYVQASTDGRWLCYFDVPEEAIGCSFQIKVYNDTSGGEYAAATESKTYTSGDNAQVLYYYETSATAEWGTWNNDIDNNDGIIEAILEPYYTCLDSADNGYGNADQLYETWLDGFDSETLIDISLDDFEYEADYDAGTKTENLTNAYNKIMTMMALQEEATADASSLLSFAGSDTAGLILSATAVVLILVIGAGALVLIKRHRREEA